MSASVVIRTPGTIRLGAGLAIALGAARLTGATKSGSAGAFLTDGSGRTAAGTD